MRTIFDGRQLPNYIIDRMLKNNIGDRHQQAINMVRQLPNMDSLTRKQVSSAIAKHELSNTQAAKFGNCRTLIL